MRIIIINTNFIGLFRANEIMQIKYLVNAPLKCLINS